MVAAGGRHDAPLRHLHLRACTVDDGLDLDLRADGAGAFGHDRDPTMFRRLIVAEDARGPVEIDEDKVDIAIVVEVPRCKPTTNGGFCQVAER